eukprot:TRINITY_DN595_c0_g4_i1.p1 TRINITY_DN595_c0_g4~~TRINITY_DN595_c0_g4_i1.p1  ORF type:complete len:1318 (+),score=282.36 TRINITY_DN595_c0_g4_i1:226-4179(+)
MSVHGKKLMSAISKENGFCADCNAKGPRWTSVTFGVVICKDCATAHRSIRGGRYSVVKSLDTDSFNAIELGMIKQMGNRRANELLEVDTNDYDKPSAKSSFDAKRAWAEYKYEQRLFSQGYSFPMLEREEDDGLKSVRDGAAAEAEDLMTRGRRASTADTIMTGYLKKQGGSHKSWKKRWFSLRSDGHLAYYKSKEDTTPLGMVRILLSSTNQTKEEEEAMRFHLTTPARTYVFECETPDEVLKWMSGLKKFSENLKTRNESSDPIMLANRSRLSLVPGQNLHHLEGWLNKQGHAKYVKDWKMRWFVLGSATIKYYNKKEDTTPAGIIRLESCSVKLAKSAGGKNCFEICTPNRRYFCSAKDAEEMTLWMDAIRLQTSTLLTTKMQGEEDQSAPNPRITSQPGAADATTPTGTAAIPKWGGAGGAAVSPRSSTWGGATGSVSPRIVGDDGSSLEDCDKEGWSGKRRAPNRRSIIGTTGRTIGARGDGDAVSPRSLPVPASKTTSEEPTKLDKSGGLGMHGRKDPKLKQPRMRRSSSLTDILPSDQGSDSAGNSTGSSTNPSPVRAAGPSVGFRTGSPGLSSAGRPSPALSGRAPPSIPVRSATPDLRPALPPSRSQQRKSLPPGAFSGVSPSRPAPPTRRPPSDDSTPAATSSPLKRPLPPSRPVGPNCASTPPHTSSRRPNSTPPKTMLRVGGVALPDMPSSSLGPSTALPPSTLKSPRKAKGAFGKQPPKLPPRGEHKDLLAQLKKGTTLRESGRFEVIDVNNPANRYIKMGPLFKMSGGGMMTGHVSKWKKRWFALSDTHLLYFHAEAECTDNKDPAGSISLASASVCSNESVHKHCLQLTTPDREFFAYSHNGHVAMQGWINAITAAAERASSAAIDNYMSQKSLEVKNAMPTEGSPGSQHSAERMTTNNPERVGFLRKSGKNVLKEYKRRYCVLHQDFLYYYKTPQDPEPLGIINLLLCTVKPVASRKGHFFEVVIPSRVYSFQASDSTEQFEWIGSIRSTSEKLYSDLPESERFGGDGAGEGTDDTTDEPNVVPGQKELSAELRAILDVDGNRACVDCGSPDPLWASINLGLLMCIECSGIHRSLGVHLSQVRSIELDRWAPDTVEFMLAHGNAKINDIYEHAHDDISEMKKLTPESERVDREAFIRAKYDEKRWADPSRVKMDAVVDHTRNVVKVHSSFYKEGWLVKRGNSWKSWKKRWFVLKVTEKEGGQLFYYKQRGDAEAAGIIQVSTAMVRVSPHPPVNRSHMFEVITPGRVFFCHAETRDMMMAWVTHIKEVVQYLMIEICDKEKEEDQGDIMILLSGSGTSQQA